MKTEDELERSRAAREKAMRALRRRHPHLPAPTSSIDLAAIRASIRRAVDEDQAARSGSDGLLRVSAVLSLLGVARSTLYRWSRKDLFPRPREVGPGVIGYRERDVLSWLAGRKVKGV